LGIKGGINMEEDYEKIRRISLGLFFVANIWLMFWYVVIYDDGLRVDCWTSSYGNTWCDVEQRNYAALLLLPLIYSVAFPLVYWIFYYPLKFIQDYTNLLKNSKEQEIRYLPMPNLPIEKVSEIKHETPNIVIKNINVKDGVITEE
jgi:hypothetical protein